MNLIEMLDKIKEQLPERKMVNFVTPSRNKPFTALKDNEVITFRANNGGGSAVKVDWPEFQQVLSLLLYNPEGVLAGDAQNIGDNLVGGEKCKLDTVEGQISHYVHGVPIGEEAKTRRATYIMPVLIKAGVAIKEGQVFKLIK